MQGWWRTILRLRFYYLREILLGVLIWSRPDSTSRSRSIMLHEPSRFVPEQFSEIELSIDHSASEKEIFSSAQLRLGATKLWLGQQTKTANHQSARARSTFTNFVNQDVSIAPIQDVPTVLSDRAVEREGYSDAKLAKSALWFRFFKPRRLSRLAKHRRSFLLTKPKRSSRLIKPKRSSRLANSRPEAHPHRRLSHRLSRWLSLLLIAGGITIAIVFVVPDLYFRFVPADVIKLGEANGSSQTNSDLIDVTPTPTPTPYIPPIDPELPAGQWLIIPEIGVNTQPVASVDPEEALATGVWIAPEYGQVGQTGLPIIMAAHRFGWKWWWQSDYWKSNSFYNLPETQVGTQVELIADQRKWTYLIYAAEEGDAITDYGADLILYTCKFLNSPIRHVRYARLIDPTRPELVLDQSGQPLSEEEKTELGKLFALPY